MRCIALAFALAFALAALPGCGAEPLHVQQSGSGDLLTARDGGAVLFCVEPPGGFSCSARSAQVVVPDADAGSAFARWRDDAMVEVFAFGGAEIGCTPRALGGLVRVALRRLPRERMPSREQWNLETRRMFAGVADSCA